MQFCIVEENESYSILDCRRASKKKLVDEGRTEP